MTEVVDSVKRVTDIMTEIMAASQEQSAGIEQINQAIGQMDQVTQQNAALVEEAAAAAASMQDRAGNLVQVVSVFKLNDGLARSTAVSPSPRRTEPKLNVIKPASKLQLGKRAAPAPQKKLEHATATAGTGDGSGDSWEEF
jgi:methyl-accepting chemotaxis protein